MALPELDEIYFDLNGYSYKKHPVHRNYAASGNGLIIDIIEDMAPKTTRSCGYDKLIIEYPQKKLKNRYHVILDSRFVFECFFGVMPSDIYITHINGDKSDDRLGNLKMKLKHELTDLELKVFDLIQEDINYEREIMEEEDDENKETCVYE